MRAEKLSPWVSLYWMYQVFDTMAALCVMDAQGVQVHANHAKLTQMTEWCTAVNVCSVLNMTLSIILIWQVASFIQYASFIFQPDVFTTLTSVLFWDSKQMQLVFGFLVSRNSPITFRKREKKRRKFPNKTLKDVRHSPHSPSSPLPYFPPWTSHCSNTNRL